MSASLNRYARRLGLLLALLSCGYLGWLMWRSLNTPGATPLQWPGLWQALGATAASVLAMTSVAMGWYALVRGVAAQTSLRRTLSAYALSQPAKYLPGNVLHFASRHWISHGDGHLHSDLISATVLESASLVAVALALGSLAAATLIPSGASWASSVSVILAAALIWTVTGAWVLLRFGDRRRRVLASMLVHLLCAAGYFLGSTLALCLLAGDRLDGVPAMQVMAAVALSWIGGYVVIGAPGGIGIREALLVGFLGGGTADAALLGAVLGQRLSMIAADLLLFVAASWWKLPPEEARSTRVTPE